MIQTICMWSACHLPNAVVSQAHSGKPTFPPPQAACVTVVSEKVGLWVVWHNSDVVRLRNKVGGGSALAGFKYVLGLSVYGGGH